MFKKLLLSIVAALFLLVSVSTTYVHAQASGEWYDQSFREWYSKVYDPDVSSPTQIFGERYTAAQVQWIIYALSAIFLNLAGGRDNMLCFMNNDVAACTRVKDSIAIDTSSEPRYAQEEKSLLSLVFADRPFSGIGYLKEKARKFNIVPIAQAQTGYGFKALSPVRQLWQSARDISYVLFVFIAIIFAFTIMFRVKLFSPQTVITVQAAIPRLVAALLLVTFSYAIAGFLVDLIYVIVGLLALLFDAGGVAVSASKAYQFMVGDIEIGVGCPGGILCIEGIGGVIEYLTLYIVVFTMALVASIFSLFTLAMLSPIGIILLAIAVIAMIVLFVVLLILMFRITWMLYRAAANVFISVIVAPLQITLGSATNMGGVGGWLKNLVSNLVVFPATGAFFYIAFVFLDYAIWAAIANVLANIPLIGSVALEIFNEVVKIFNQASGLQIPEPSMLTEAWMPPLISYGGKGFPLLLCMISMSILLMIPKLPDIIKSIVSGQPFAFGTALGEGFAPITAPIKGAWGGVTGGIQKGIGEWTSEAAKGIGRRVEAGGRRLIRGMRGGGPSSQQTSSVKGRQKQPGKT